MESEISLQDLYQHPVVAEIISENKQLRATLSEKPEVKDLNDVPLPYTIKRHVLINEGVHNGLFYPAQILRMALKQHEGLSLFLDHHPNDQGGTALTWCGSIINPSWSEADKAIVADVDIVDPKTAIALAYGAKFGISATVDVDTIKKGDDSEVANDPIFKSYSIVLDPAVRETMLNENGIKKEEEPKEMKEELDLKSDLKPAMETLEDAIKRATAKRDNDILVSLRQTKAILTKLSGSTYPYPAKEMALPDDLEPRFSALEQAILELTPVVEVDDKSEEVKTLEGENKVMKEQLEKIRFEKLAAYSSVIMEKELKLGLVTEADLEARRKELEAMDEFGLQAVDANLDKTIQILEAGDKKLEELENIKPKERRDTSNGKEKTVEHKELDKDAVKAHDQKILEMMLSEQTHNRMPLGGF